MASSPWRFTRPPTWKFPNTNGTSRACGVPSLLFISAVTEQIRAERTRREEPDEGQESTLRRLGSGLSALFGEQIDVPYAGAARSALRPTEAIRVERVTYRSPLQIILGFHEDPVSFGILAGTAASAAYVAANRAIKLWERISHAPVSHAKADRAVTKARDDVERARKTVFDNDIAKAEARIKEAQARVREAEATLRESEVNLALQAHELISSEPDLIKALYSADQASAQSGVSDPDTNAARLMLRVGQASQALAFIDDIRFVNEDDVKG